DAVGVDARSARRMLQRLAVEAYVVQDGGHRRRYRMTLRIVAVAGRVLARAMLPRLAAPVVAQLAKTGTRAAHLWIAVDADVFCVVHADPNGEVCGARLDVEEHVSAAHAAAAVVLDPDRRRLWSCAYVRDGDAGTSAAAVLDRGVVVAALGVTGDVDDGDVAAVANAARALSEALADGAA
ncbi:MAG TPA: hypothetical protein VFZ89_06375, partial [Solirubrobacteraceae bacterium]